MKDLKYWERRVAEMEDQMVAGDEEIDDLRERLQQACEARKVLHSEAEKVYAEYGKARRERVGRFRKTEATPRGLY